MAYQDTTLIGLREKNTGALWVGFVVCCFVLLIGCFVLFFCFIVLCCCFETVSKMSQFFLAPTGALVVMQLHTTGLLQIKAKKPFAKMYKSGFRAPTQHNTTQHNCKMCTLYWDSCTTQSTNTKRNKGRVHKKKPGKSVVFYQTRGGGGGEIFSQKLTLSK